LVPFRKVSDRVMVKGNLITEGAMNGDKHNCLRKAIGKKGGALILQENSGHAGKGVPITMASPSIGKRSKEEEA